MPRRRGGRCATQSPAFVQTCRAGQRGALRRAVPRVAHMVAERVLAKGKGVRHPLGGEFFVQDGDARDHGGRAAERLPRIKSVHRRRHVRQLVKLGLAYGVAP